jgi:hypothetical protein
MQIKSFLIGTGLLACHACTHAQNHLSERRTRPVPVVDSVCAPTFLNKLVFEADSIETFLLDGWKKDTSTKGLEGFKIEKAGKILTGSAKQQFISLLKKPALYNHDSLFKRCEFVPTVGFRWHSKGKTKNLLMALNCDVWKWYGFQPHILRVEADPAHDTMMAFIAPLFPAADHRLLARGEAMGGTASDPFDEPVAPVQKSVEPAAPPVPSNPKDTKLQQQRGRNHSSNRLRKDN